MPGLTTAQRSGFMRATWRLVHHYAKTGAISEPTMEKFWARANSWNWSLYDAVHKAYEMELAG